jgi:peptide chain release factor subunit 1
MEESEEHLHKWKIKKLIQKLDEARGNGTSMISLLIDKNSTVSQISKMLTDEYGTAKNIKSHTNKLSVESAIRSAQEKLKLYSKIPPNGLCIYVGTELTDNNKERKVSYDFEPFKPLNTFLYRCDSKFHTEPLGSLLEDEDVFGFIIVDGNGCTFAKVSGSNRIITHVFSVDLPRKHSKGGQSSNRYEYIRREKVHNYMTKVSEKAIPIFITNNLPNVVGLIIAGSANLKTKIVKDDTFDKRLKSIILSIVDINYGGESGLNQAISLSKDVLKNTKFIKEKDILSNYFDHINRDTGLICYGIKDTMYALDNGVVDKLIVYEDLDIYRIELDNEDKEVRYLTKDKMVQIQDTILSEQLLVEYLTENIKTLSTKIQLITDKTSESMQFINGFGGFGGFLRFKIEIPNDIDDEDSYDDDDFI